jgi:tripartite-type tricarboxylate transporter receptor subunit TctC
MAESGFPGFDATGWFGLMAPAGTSPAVVDKIHRDAVSILSLPESRKRLDELGLEPIGNSAGKRRSARCAKAPHG